MILERLRVEGFRHLAAPYEFIPDERLTIISAPNGTGKSTLLEALYSGLLEKHTVTGTVANERFAARGRDLVPRIVIDFRVGNIRYRLRKHFLREKLSRLERWELDRYQPLKEGTASDDFVRELFAADAPNRGALDNAKHWGLAHILWSPGGVRYAALPSTAGDQVRSMLGDVAVATLGERAVIARVASRYEHYFTDSGSFARSAQSANLPAREAAIGAAKAAVIEAKAAVVRLDELRRSHEDSDWNAQRLAAKRAEIRRQLEETKQLVASFDELAAHRQTWATAEERARMKYNEHRRRSDGITAGRLKRGAIAVRRDGVKTQIDAAQARLILSTQTLCSLSRAVDDVAAQSLRVLMRAAEVTAAGNYANDLNDARLLRERIGFTTADLESIQALEERRASIHAPARDELNRYRATDVERRNLEAKIAASTLTLELTPTWDMPVDVLIGNTPGIVGLEGGNATTVTGPEQIVVVVPGFGRIKVRAADSAATARRKHAPLAARLAAALARFGANSIAELEGRTELATELDREIAMRQRAIAERLRGDSPGADRRRLFEAQTRIDAIEATFPQWREHQPDAAALRAAFDRELQQSADLENEAKLRLRAAQHPHDDLSAQLEDLHATDSALVNAEREHSFRLDDLESDGHDDAARDAELMQLALEWTSARAQCEQIDQALGAFSDDPHHTRAVLEAQEREAGQHYEQSLSHAQRDLALLEEFSQRGSYHRWAEAEEALAMLTEDYRVAHAEANAIRLLWNSFTDVRKQRIEAVLAPVESGASRYLARIAGTSLGPIQIAPDLTPSGVRHGPSGAFVEVESTLSAGEREQIFIATRFAIADVISGARGRQLFVLDDILTATDPGRLRRFVTILEELSRDRLQIVVTTADASRYLGIPGAKHIDLRQALSIAAAA